MAGTLSAKLIPRLLARFPNRDLRIHAGKRPKVSFRAAHPDVGDLEIYDDDDELTIAVGRLTHGHFSPSNYAAPQDAREVEVIERVMAFLEEVFSDQVEFWSSDKAGGWHPRGEAPIVPRPKARRYTWSGPLERP